MKLIGKIKQLKSLINTLIINHLEKDKIEGKDYK